MARRKNVKRIDPRYFMDEKVEDKQRLNEGEFELGFDIDDDSDYQRAQALEWVQRESTEIVPAVKTVLNFLKGDEPRKLGMHMPSVGKLTKWFTPILRLFSGPDAEEKLLQLYKTELQESSARINEGFLAEDSRNIRNSPTVQRARKLGFDDAADALVALADLGTSQVGQDTKLMRVINQQYYKGKLGEMIHGANGLVRQIDSAVRNHRESEGRGDTEEGPEAAAPEQNTPAAPGRGSTTPNRGTSAKDRGYMSEAPQNMKRRNKMKITKTQLKQIIKEELGAMGSK
jgi:hypothetical protein